MNPQDAIDFSREAIKTCMLVGGPILLASLLIGILVGVFQAMTQVQDQTVSFVPKILLLIVMIGLCLPWLTDQMMEFAKLSFEKPMTQWAGSSTTSAPRLFPRDRSESDDQPNTKTKVAVSPPELVPAQPETIQPGSATPARLASTRSSTTSRSDFGSPNFGQSKFKDLDPEKRPTFETPRFQTPAEYDHSAPVNSPFLLPHYRTSPVSKSDTGG